jgi:hypothetical protein
VTQLDEVAALMQTREFMVRSFARTEGSSSTLFELVPIRSSDFLAADPPNHLVDPAERHHERLGQVLKENIRSSYNDGRDGTCSG